MVVLVIIVTLVSSMLASCAHQNEKKLNASSQFVTCVYDKEDGTVESIPPGGGTRWIEDDAEVWRVPTSQRFWNIDTDEKVRDAGAPAGILGLDSGYKEVVMNAHAEFYVNQAHACDLNTRHIKRNVQSDQYGEDDTESVQKAGYNVRGDAAQPWFVLLNEKLSAAMVKQGKPLLGRYSWEYYNLEFPINADTNGKLKCGEVSEDCQPGERAIDALAPDYGKLVTDQLNKQIGKDYFCGTGYDPEKPDVCPPIFIEITNISLVDKKPLQDRQKLVDITEKTDNDQRLAQLTEDATKAAVDAQRAKLEQSKALQELIDSYGGVDPGVAEAQRAAELDRILAAGKADVAVENARAEIAKDLAACQEAKATGRDCALIIAALHDQYPQGNGTNVQVNPGD